MTSHREDYPFYIGTSDEDIQAMLKELGLNKLDDLYAHIDSEFLLDEMDLPKHLDANAVKKHMQGIADKNKTMVSFIGDGLQNFTIPKIVEKVCEIRGLTTAYTPYQPERSQGTLPRYKPAGKHSKSIKKIVQLMEDLGFEFVKQSNKCN